MRPGHRVTGHRTAPADWVGDGASAADGSGGEGAPVPGVLHPLQPPARRRLWSGARAALLQVFTKRCSSHPAVRAWCEN